MTKKNNPEPRLQMTHLIQLTDGRVALVDADEYLWMSCFRWRAVRGFRSFYAKTSIMANGRYRDVGMHRLIARTPSGMVCHHKNRNSLDNRKANLLNMSKNEHKLAHLNNSLSIKFEEKNGHAPDLPTF